MKRGNFIILLWSLTNILDFDLFHYLHTLQLKNTIIMVISPFSDQKLCNTKQSKITLTSLEVYTSDQSMTIKSCTGWKYILTDWVWQLISWTGWKYKLPTSPWLYFSNCHGLVGSINFQPVHDILKHKTLDWLEVYITLNKLQTI